MTCLETQTLACLSDLETNHFRGARDDRAKTPRGTRTTPTQPVGKGLPFSSFALHAWCMHHAAIMKLFMNVDD